MDFEELKRQSAELEAGVSWVDKPEPEAVRAWLNSVLGLGSLSAYHLATMLLLRHQAGESLSIQAKDFPEIPARSYSYALKLLLSAKLIQKRKGRGRKKSIKILGLDSGESKALSSRKRAGKGNEAPKQHQGQAASQKAR